MTTTSIYRGTCDASAAVRIGETDRFIAASDEDSVLRVFDRAAPGLPLTSVDLVAFLKPVDPTAELDLEGAAQLGDRVYWVGSHGRDKDGAEQPNRQCFLATYIDVAGPSVAITPIGNRRRARTESRGTHRPAGL
jgi:hypothetical protein